MSQYLCQSEEELGYDVAVRGNGMPVSDRRGAAQSRQLNGQERRSQQARYSRRPAPTRMSGSHGRRNKRSGL